MQKILYRSLALCLLSACATANDAAPEHDFDRPEFDRDGTVHVSAFDLPPSSFLSEEALQQQQMRALMPQMPTDPGVDIQTRRSGLEKSMAPRVARTMAQYPVEVVDRTIAGVPTRVVTPRDGDFDAERVLINLHGGAFSLCAGACAMLESIPIAAIGGYQVITVDYRMAPESRHPAGVQDVAAVYRELLNDYQPRNIGIYGCSAGGALTAQAAAWLPAHDLPQAGAVGIFGAGGVRFSSGDSAYLAAYIDGSFPPPPGPGQPRPDMSRGYFDGVDRHDPIVSPAMHLDVLANFPPALIITGTRAMDLSPAVFTNSQLLKAGIDSTLVVGEGMGHCYIYASDLPEARDAYDVIVNFFRKHLR